MRKYAENPLIHDSEEIFLDVLQKIKTLNLLNT
jgi:hypothetical protein